MKTFAKTFILLFFIGLTFSGCEKIKSLADVKFDAELDADLNVTVPADGLKSGALEGFTFSKSATIDPTSDADIEKYFDKLKSFEVYEVTGTIKSVTGGPVKILSGTISVTSGSTVAEWTITNFNVVNGATIVLDNSGGQWDKINKILDGKKTFTAMVQGTTDKSGISFTVHVVIKSHVKANALG
jgi:hypothetical protein